MDQKPTVCNNDVILCATRDNDLFDLKMHFCEITFAKKTSVAIVDVKARKK